MYYNRDLSWLEFNYRVLQEAANETVPLFDRIKFLSIFSSNLDEFFKEMNDHEGDTNQFEFLSSRDTLTACESNLKRVRDLLPQEKRPDMEDRIKKIQYLQTRCKP